MPDDHSIYNTGNDNEQFTQCEVGCRSFKFNLLHSWAVIAINIKGERPVLNNVQGQKNDARYRK